MSAVRAAATAAATVADGFACEAGAYFAANGPEPDFGAWAWRLQAVLRDLLEELAVEDGLQRLMSGD
jgi:hypothetical protein